MGWYITCKVCGASAKYMHPDCGHKEEAERRLREKMIGGLIVSVTSGYGGMWCHYQKNGEDFYVEYTCPGDYRDSGLHEITKEEFLSETIPSIADELRDMQSEQLALKSADPRLSLLELYLNGDMVLLKSIETVDLLQILQTLDDLEDIPLADDCPFNTRLTELNKLLKTSEKVLLPPEKDISELLPSGIHLIETSDHAQIVTKLRNWCATKSGLTY